MSTTQIIYGLECTIPDQPPVTKIDGSKRAVNQQKFRRVEMPKSFDDVEFDADGDPIFDEEQTKFIEREIDRCVEGYWCMIKGVPTYLPGFYYYYLTYWTLESGIKPEYRTSSRKFFIFFNECYEDPYILFIIRGKKRREGATSEGTSIETQIATFGENMRCGNISKTGPDVIDMFQNMVVYGYEALPIFLKPRMDGSTNSKKQLTFLKPATRGKESKAKQVVKKREGLNSLINYRNTALNSYDSGRWSFVLVDESGKWEEVDVSKYILILQQVLKEGGKRGFSYWPTTINPPNKGGANFKKIWDKANHFKFGRETPLRAVRFFQDAAEGLDGFIDEYGESVIEPPDKDTLSFLTAKQGERIPRERIPSTELEKGSARYLDDQLAMLTDSDDRAEFMRMYPRREEDMFEFGESSSPFNLEKIKARIRELEDNPVPLRRGDLSPDFKTKNVDFYDNPKGNWLIYKPPVNPNDFVVEERGILGRMVRIAKPLNSHTIKIGVDTYRSDKTKSLGSKGVICVGDTFDSTDPDSGRPWALFVGRPSPTELFWREILLACMWYGAKANIEIDATQEYKKYFNNTMPNVLDANCYAFLSRTPDAAIDDNRKGSSKNRFDIGSSSADPFTFAKEIELAQFYVQKYIHLIVFIAILTSLRDMDVDDRTKSDEAIGFMMWLLGITGETKARKAEARKTPLVQTYRVGSAPS